MHGDARYPHDLERWWLQAACRAAGMEDPDAAIESLEADAARLSDRFTTERPEGFVDYFSVPRSLAAYGIMFFPQTLVRTRLVLREARPPGDPEPMRVLDLGCGTGAASLAALLELPARAISLTAVDRSADALATLTALFAGGRDLWPKASIETIRQDARRDGLAGPFEIVLASFVVNELFADGTDAACLEWLHTQLSRLSPGGRLVILDPAGQGPCGRLQRLRDRLAANGRYRIVAPCPHHGSCPMLRGGEGYCHDVRPWRVPESLNLINRRMFRSVHDLKYGLLAVANEPPPPPAEALRARLVAPMHRTKGRFLTRACCADGQLRKLEIMTRGFSREQIDAVESLSRGDRVRLDGLRLLGDGKTWRVEKMDPIAD